MLLPITDLAWRFNRALIQLRTMHAEDESVFSDLYAEMRVPELAVLPWSADEKRAFCDSQYSLQDAHYRQHYADLQLLAICHNGLVIGRLYLATVDGALVVMDITIAASARGHCIGSQLLAEVLRGADARGQEVRLHVEPTNPATRLYLRLGFVAVGEAGIYQQMVRPARPRTVSQ